MNDSAKPGPSFAFKVRASLLDLVFVWMLISFVRLFVVENYVVPTGSMTPTLVGGRIAYLDYNNDDRRDVALAGTAAGSGKYTILVRHGAAWRPDYVGPLPLSIRSEVLEGLHRRKDNILVNKFAYWFARPERGDIAIFKPPAKVFSRAAPVYVKRVVGVPGEMIGLAADGRLLADGRRVDEPPFFADQEYSAYEGFNGLPFRSLRLGEADYLFFGDNTLNSQDGRQWGAVDRARIKGKVFARYWPLSAASFVGP